MSKSIIIFGKGPSVLRCNREVVNQHDDIAIINYPVINDFFYGLIKDREIKYHFANCATFDTRYDDNMNNKLNIKGIYNTHYKLQIQNYKNFLKNKDLFKDCIREKCEEYFRKIRLNPSSGILALQYLINTKLYNKITLVGYDNYKLGEQTYYYKPEEYNNSIKYLFENNTIKQNGEYNQVSGHDPEKTKKYLEGLFLDYPNINLKFITEVELNNLVD